MNEHVLLFTLLGIFLASSPIAMVGTYWLDYERPLCAIANSYGFSIAMCCLYFYPFVYPFPSSSYNFKQRIDNATFNWIVWLSVLTEVAFQIPHNLFVAQLHESRGSAFEWPFYAYGLCDSRWSDYHSGTALTPEVWLINWNDGILGLVVIAFYFIFRCQTHEPTAHRAKVAMALVILFRDATLWRETVEYLWDHHRQDYPYTTQDERFRVHAITCLWLVNVIWLIAPCFTIAWVYNLVFPVDEPLGQSRKLK